MLYVWNQYNIVNQLYLNKKNKKYTEDEWVDVLILK